MKKKMKVEKIAAVCAGDCCRAAVIRAYREMCDQDTPELAAFDAALAVFQWYHPEVASRRATEIVGHWVHEGAVH